MRIASMVVRARSEHVDMVSRTVSAIPGVQVHAVSPESGCVIVTVEDGQGYAVSESLVAVNLAEHVVTASLVYEYTDENLKSESVEA